VVDKVLRDNEFDVLFTYFRVRTVYCVGTREVGMHVCRYILASLFCDKVGNCRTLFSTVELSVAKFSHMYGQ